MKKTIIVFLIIILSGCAAINRFMMPEAQKPEKNVLSGSVSGVTVSQLDLLLEFMNSTHLKNVELSAFYGDDDLLYFSFQAVSDASQGNATKSAGIYSYNLKTKAFESMIMFDKDKGYAATSIVLLNDVIYYSSGCIVEGKQDECNYEIAMVKNNTSVVLLKETVFDYFFIPKLIPFDNSSIVFLQTEQTVLSTTKKQIRYGITQIHADSTMTTSTQFNGTLELSDGKNSNHPQSNTFTVDNKTIAYTVFKDQTAWIYSASLDSASGLIIDLPPIRVGKGITPVTLSGFGNHWFVTTFGGYAPGSFVMDVFDQKTGKRTTTQKFDGPTQAFALDSLDEKTGLLYGNFENDGTGRHPLGVSRLFTGFLEGNTLKYKRIGEMKLYEQPIVFAKFGIGRYLLKGTLDPQKPDLQYILLEIK